MDTFNWLYRKLAQATAGTLIATLVLFVLALICAGLGLAVLVPYMNSVTIGFAYIFAALLGVFLLTSLVRALVQFLQRRSTPVESK